MTVGVGVIGLGFMGRTHVGAYRRAAAAGLDNRLVAVCDADPARRAGEVAAGGNLDLGDAGERLFDPDEVRGHEEAGALLEDPAVDVVSICTPTATHVDLAIRALAAGKHVLVEKPIALAADEARRLADAASSASTLCLPAMCMRFWPGWSWLKERVDDGAFGPVRSAVFRRLGTRPAWGGFYADPAQTGGALFDLHVHDADFVRHCFGPPDEVVAAGDLDHVTALYRYEGGPAHVAAEGGWDHAPGFPFRMRYTVVFEGATADFDLARETPLMLAEDGVFEPVPLPEGDGYDGEVAELLGAIRDGRTALRATCEEAVGLTEMLERERAAVER
ncbi:MAG: Gfo/Idh/MocA family protein [Planctomycetota bacterium JB042]